MKTFLTLIPPSEGKTPCGNGAPLKKVTKDVKAMMVQLQSMDDPAKVLGVKGVALEKAIAANNAVLSAKTMPAIERYSGVVYKAIEWGTLNPKAQEWLNDHVRIVSAFFGLVSPQDLLPDYKLKIDKLGAAKYWQPLITRQLKNVFVIDLLPQAHRKAVAYTDGVRVEFVFNKQDKTVPAGHHGKQIKGRFVRWLCEQQITDVSKFKTFQDEGFRWKGMALDKDGTNCCVFERKIG